MKTDRNGTAQLAPGAEQHEVFDHPTKKGYTLTQYDYRATDGELFSTVAPSLTICLERKAEWLTKTGRAS